MKTARALLAAHRLALRKFVSAALAPHASHSGVLLDWWRAQFIADAARECIRALVLQGVWPSDPSTQRLLTQPSLLTNSPMPSAETLRKIGMRLRQARNSQP
jgi:hypothetical protein